MKRAYILILLIVFNLKLFSQKNDFKWDYVGPKRTQEQVKGLTQSVWVDTTNLNFVLAGSGSGGLFLCENALDTLPQWRCITDTYNGMALGISDICVVPKTNNNTIYVSTLSYCGGMAIPYGVGILKTENRGKTWEEVGPQTKEKNSNGLFGLAMNPNNTKQMVAYNQHSVYITADSWNTYTTVAIPLSKETIWFICDAEFAPFEEGKIYITNRVNGKVDCKIFILEDFGNTVKDITPAGLQGERVECEVINSPKFKGKFYIAAGINDISIKFFDGKKYSENLNATPIVGMGGGTYWTLEFKVNQKDTAVMYVGLTECSRSTDGGKTFEKIAYYNMHNAHADNRGSYLISSKDRTKGNSFYLANDGGISVLEKNNPVSWKSLNGLGLDINQFFGISVAQSDSLLLVGGTQDNGGFVITDKTLINTMYSCGDGYNALVLSPHSAIHVCNVPLVLYNNILTGAQNYVYINDQQATQRKMLLLLDSFVYSAHHQVWRILKKDLEADKSNWTQVSFIPDYFNNRSTYLKNQSVTCLDVSRKGTGIIGYGNQNWQDSANNGKTFFCTNLNAKKPVWTDISGLLHYNGMEINRWYTTFFLKIDVFDEYKFYLISRNSFNQSDAKFYEITYLPDSARCVVKEQNEGLPNLAKNHLTQDKINGYLYVSCDDGVYYKSSNTDSLQWRKLNVGKTLPNILVFSTDINYVTNTLYAGTHGRGIWKCQLPKLDENKIFIRKNGVENGVVRVTTSLTIKRNKKLEVRGKLILYTGAKVILESKSNLILAKGTKVVNEFNEVVDLNKFLVKGKSANVIRK